MSDIRDGVGPFLAIFALSAVLILGESDGNLFERLPDIDYENSQIKVT